MDKRLIVANVAMIFYIIIEVIFNISLTQASSENKPVLRLYQEGNHVKLEWATEILPQDVLYETGFEEDEGNVRFTYDKSDKELPANRRYGGQRFTKNEKFEGERSIEVENTIENSNRYYLNLNNEPKIYPENNSWMLLKGKRVYVENGIDLTASYRVKTDSNGKITLGGHGGFADFGTSIEESYGVKVYFTKRVNKGDTEVYVNNVHFFKDYIDRGVKLYLANMKGKYTGHLTPIGYDIEKGTIKLNGPFQGVFEVNDPVLKHNNRVPVKFEERKINENDNWGLFNVSTKVKDYKDYDTLIRGFELSITTKTGGKVWIDDLKIGHATQVELYKDNNKIYEGKLSDFEDTDATDKAKPNKVTDYDVEKKGDKRTLKIVEPKDIGSKYTYQVKAISNDGVEVYDSKEETIEVVSGIEGYSYVINKNKNANPDGKINNKDGEIELSQDIYEDYYLHIQAIDKAGNKSEVSHIKLNKVKDIVKPTVKLSLNPPDWTNGNVTIDVDAKDEGSGIKKIMYNGKNIVRNGDFSEGDKHWVKYDNQHGESNIEFQKGKVIFNDTEDGLRNRIAQQGLLDDNAMETEHYIEVTARGEGVINARYKDILTTGKPKELENVNEFKKYVFNIQPHKNIDNGVIVERIGHGYMEVTDVKVYAQKDITDSKQLEVTKNGTYNFVVEDNAGNITTESITVSNIDREPPTVKMTQTPEGWTNESVIINVEASDKHSGIKKIKYFGESMIENGDFSEGTKKWVSSEGKFDVENGVLHLRDNEVVDNKVYQSNAFKDSGIGAVYYAEMEARGNGKLNARYAIKPGIGGIPQRDQVKQLTDTFEKYRFFMERRDISTNSFMIERINKGDIEIRNVVVYGEKDIIDNKLEVTENGVYAFVVEDTAGNKTTASITISNIDKTAPTINIDAPRIIYENEKRFAKIIAKDAESGIATIEYNWSDSSENPKHFENECIIESNDEKSVECELEIKDSVGDHYLHVRAKDLSGNVSVIKHQKISRDGSLTMKFNNLSKNNTLKFPDVTLNGVDEQMSIKKLSVTVNDTRIDPSWSLSVDINRKNFPGVLMLDEHSKRELTNTYVDENKIFEHTYKVNIPKRTIIAAFKKEYEAELTYVLTDKRGPLP